MDLTGNLPVIDGTGGAVAPPTDFERGRIEDLVNAGMSYRAIGAHLREGRDRRLLPDAHYARLNGALLEWALALITLDTEDDDNLSDGA